MLVVSYLRTGETSNIIGGILALVLTIALNIYVSRHEDCLRAKGEIG